MISITIPAEYAERFRIAAEHELGKAAQELEEPSHVLRQTREQPGGLNIGGSVEVLQSCVNAVLLDVTQDLRGQAELTEADSAPVREELEFWRGIRARLAAAAAGLA